MFCIEKFSHQLLTYIKYKQISIIYLMEKFLKIWLNNFSPVKTKKENHKNKQERGAKNGKKNRYIRVIRKTIYIK